MDAQNIYCRSSSPRGTGSSVSNDPLEPADRLVILGRDRQWEVRAPIVSEALLRANTRHEAVQWAWNITCDTGGRAVTLRHGEQAR